MQERKGDIWELARGKALCISTNGILTQTGALVMGKGIALEAKNRFHGIDNLAGHLVATGGNKVHYLGPYGPFDLVTFPVKTHWREMAKPELIKRSTEQLEMLTTVMKWKEVYIPHVGCANGGLQWKDVYPILNILLDHRFIAVEQV
jgi:hypothetical protein